MGVAPSSPTLPVMSCDELATLAEDNQKSNVAEVIRTNQIDGAVAEDLDDEVIEEMRAAESAGVDEITLLPSMDHQRITLNECKEVLRKL